MCVAKNTGYNIFGVRRKQKLVETKHGRCSGTPGIIDTKRRYRKPRISRDKSASKLQIVPDRQKGRQAEHGTTIPGSCSSYRDIPAVFFFVFSIIIIFYHSHSHSHSHIHGDKLQTQKQHATKCFSFRFFNPPAVGYK